MARCWRGCSILTCSEGARDAGVTGGARTPSPQFSRSLFGNPENIAYFRGNVNGKEEHMKAEVTKGQMDMEGGERREKRVLSWR